jgi:hypothetical protein
MNDIISIMVIRIIDHRFIRDAADSGPSRRAAVHLHKSTVYG